MADYYSILGLSKNATEIEIKTAFRKLAKVYHPDKNPNDPNAKHLFELILKAYNTLINPHARHRYDNTQFLEPAQKSQTKHPRKKGQKEWTVTEEDLKRRDYYKKHYQQVKTKTAAAQTINAKTNHTDYKYVLFATPIAVGLLMLIVSIFGSEPKPKLNPEKEIAPFEMAKPATGLSNGDKPYSRYFGVNKIYDTPHTLKINNSSSYDAVIAVYDKTTNKHVQHTYLKNSFSAEFTGLPDGGVYWKCMLGHNWNNTRVLYINKISGGFDTIVQYQNWEKLPTLFPQKDEEINLLYLIDPNSKHKEFISNETEFFKK
jgi:hypothetical protein